MVPLAAAEPASGSAHWAFMGSEIALAVVLFAVGLLVDRRASRRRRTTAGPALRAIAQADAPISVTVRVSGAHAAGPLPAGPLAGRVLATGPLETRLLAAGSFETGVLAAGALGTGALGTAPLGTELVAARAGEAGDQL